MTWQPIATAPRNRLIQLHDPVLGTSRVGSWDAAREQWIVDGVDVPCAIVATHWREIEGPKRKDGE